MVLKIVFFAVAACGLDNGLGITPQMGYNSWYDWQCSINETNLRATATAIVDKGLRDLGYHYFNLDDCWAKGRYPNGTVYPDPVTFPSGMPSLANFAHNNGLLFGVYTDRGTMTCGQRPGALGYETIDAQTYARWGVDYLKEDSCFASDDHATAFQQYGAMRDALNATGRKIFFSLCGWNSWYAPVGKSLGNSWRIGPDDTNWAGVLANIDIMANVASYAGPGGWNDPCLLLSTDWQGNLAVTELQSRAQFSMWAIVASPLLISGSVVHMSDYTLQTYSNKEVIAISQDSLGQAGMRIVGGNLSANNPYGESIPGGAVPCVASDPTQQWTFDQPAKGYIRRKDGKCLNVANCQTEVIVWDNCPLTGCCNDCDNMVFTLNATDSKLHAGKAGTLCVAGTIPWETAVDLELRDCSDSRALKWMFNSSTSQLHQLNSQSCLGQGIAPTIANATNVWAREISENKRAILFINGGADNADVTCDVECFQKMGFVGGDVLEARDVWLHAGLQEPILVSKGFTAEALPPHGGHLLLVVAKI